MAAVDRRDRRPAAARVRAAPTRSLQSAPAPNGRSAVRRPRPRRGRRASARTASSCTTPPTSRSRSAPARRCASSPRCSATHGAGVRARPARSDDATVGGVLATGLSGHRRLRYGPLRDRVLEVRFVTADGRLVKGGGPTVKNVSGFDLPAAAGRFVRHHRRARAGHPALPAACRRWSEWCETDADPFDVRRAHLPAVLHRVGRAAARTCSSRASPPTSTHERRAAGAEPVDGAPPTGPTDPTGGASRCARRRSATSRAALADTGVRWLAEVGVGTVHVARRQRSRAGRRPRCRHRRTAAGCCARAGAPGLDGFGRRLPNLAIMQRVRAAFDPDGQVLTRSATARASRSPRR